MNTEILLKRLERPKEAADVVLDTDTFNEIDDQYALAYMLLSADRLNVKAIYAAPFSNEKAAAPAEGMEKSYQEILKLLFPLYKINVHFIQFNFCGFSFQSLLHNFLLTIKQRFLLFLIYVSYSF